MPYVTGPQILTHVGKESPSADDSAWADKSAGAINAAIATRLEGSAAAIAATVEAAATVADLGVIMAADCTGGASVDLQPLIGAAVGAAVQLLVGNLDFVQHDSDQSIVANLYAGVPLIEWAPDKTTPADVMNTFYTIAPYLEDGAPLPLAGVGSLATVGSIHLYAAVVPPGAGAPVGTLAFAELTVAALTDGAALFNSRGAPHGVLSVGPDGDVVRLGADSLRASLPVIRRVHPTAGIGIG